MKWWEYVMEQSQRMGAWIPDDEVYCRTCRRMVAALDGRPALHHRFAQYDEYGRRFESLWAVPCKGWYGLTGMTHGMEDPAAAFWPTEPDTYPQPEAKDEPPAASDNSAPGHRFSFTMRSPT